MKLMRFHVAQWFVCDIMPHCLSRDYGLEISNENAYDTGKLHRPIENVAVVPTTLLQGE